MPFAKGKWPDATRDHERHNRAPDGQLITITDRRPPPQHDRFIQAIAIFKFLKTLLFVLAALGAFGLMQKGIADRAREWGSDLAFTTGQQLVRHASCWSRDSADRGSPHSDWLRCSTPRSSPRKASASGWSKRWAEYLTVIATGSLIPFEVWEMFNRPIADQVRDVRRQRLRRYLPHRSAAPATRHGAPEPAMPNAS